MSRPRLVVFYDRGAAGPAEIVAGLAPLGDVVFAVPDSPHTRDLRPVLDALASTVDLADATTDVTAVRGLAPAAVLTFSEQMLRRASHCASALGLPGHPPATVELLTDKAAQRDRLNCADVGPVAAALVTTAADWPRAVAAVGLPAVVKPVRGEGSRQVYEVTDVTAGGQLVAGLLAGDGPALLVEELLTGPDGLAAADYVSVESVVSAGTASHVAVTGKLPLLPPFRERGQFWPSDLSADDHDAVLATTTAALTALGVHTGLTHTEIKLTPDGPRIIEVNGRLGGNLPDLAQRAADVDLVGYAGQVALGERPQVAPAQPRAVHFQVSALTPVTPVWFAGVDGARDVRRLPGVTSHQLLVQPGTQLPGGVSTTWLDMLRGEAPDHATMWTLLADAAERLHYRFLVDSETKTLTGAALASSETL